MEIITLKVGHGLFFKYFDSFWVMLIIYNCGYWTYHFDSPVWAWPEDSVYLNWPGVLITTGATMKSQYSFQNKVPFIIIVRYGFLCPYLGVYIFIDDWLYIFFILSESEAESECVGKGETVHGVRLFWGCVMYSSICMAIWFLMNLKKSECL